MEPKKSILQDGSNEEDFKKDQKFISDFAGLMQTIASFMGNNPPPLPERELFSLFCRIRINSFVITDQWGADLAAGLFLQAAHLDHACKPNLEYIFRGKEIVCLAVEGITDRSEARINYGDPLSTTSSRQEMLRRRYFFTCTCSLCIDSNRDRKISSLICCESFDLSEAFPLAQAKPSNKLKFIVPYQNPSSDLVLCCPSCETLYSHNLINQLSTFLTSFTEKTPTVERAADAIRLYCLLRGLKSPVKSNTKLLDNPQILESYVPLLPAYYRLFGRSAHHVLLARVCRMGCFALRMENTEAVVQAIKTGSDPKDFSRARFNRLLIAMGLDYFEWQMCWNAGPQFIIGLHALDLSGFLLRWITDAQFINEDYMDSVSRLSACSLSTKNLAQVLCRLAVTAERLLDKFAPFDACVAESLKRLRALV
ncbi:hypothetical protein FBUS_10645 [Fasciolopsis buskii]|uniref:SET domain-containing protein n=1 Tax=Fasciolopsis buskii TaxID=27845 RepID=A0A8E0VHY5_9TREM|nr:hypothetical protein FBUS_10645 [Fasciolopsis buski]